MNTLRNIGKLLTTSALAGVFAAAIMTGIHQLRAAVGTAPPAAGGYALVDIQWLLGLAGGTNYSFQGSIVAHAGGTQAACTLLPTNTAMISVDTVASSGDSVCLPFAVAGTNLTIANTSSTTLNVFGQATVNPLTAVADTINTTAGSSAYQLTTHTNADCFAAVNGKWSCVKGS